MQAEESVHQLIELVSQNSFSPTRTSMNLQGTQHQLLIEQSFGEQVNATNDEFNDRASGDSDRLKVHIIAEEKEFEESELPQIRSDRRR